MGAASHARRQMHRLLTRDQGPCVGRRPSPQPLTAAPLRTRAACLFLPGRPRPRQNPRRQFHAWPYEGLGVLRRPWGRRSHAAMAVPRTEASSTSRRLPTAPSGPAAAVPGYPRPPCPAALHPRAPPGLTAKLAAGAGRRLRGHQPDGQSPGLLIAPRAILLRLRPRGLWRSGAAGPSAGRGGHPMSGPPRAARAGVTSPPRC